MRISMFLCLAMSSLAWRGVATAQPATPTTVAPAGAPASTPAAAPAQPAAAPAQPAADPAAAPAAAPTPGASGEPSAPPSAAVPGATPPGVKDPCNAAINADQEWTNELKAKLTKFMMREIDAGATTPDILALRAVLEKTISREAHDADAKLIALNKRHVVMAYAALWLVAVGFLLVQWRRQQALRRQLEALRRDLDQAIKGGTAA
jgi:hypothetical protein